jgi:LPXTG-motif cell wall-anchored protein
VYILGYFENASADPTADFVARWNGASWEGIGSNGAGESAFECEFNDCYFTDVVIAPNGDVYVSGDFDLTGQPERLSIARWDGTTWSAVGNRTFYISAMALDSDSRLVVTGDFENLSGVPEADYIAKWDGDSWLALGSNGTGDGFLNAMGYLITAGSNSSLYVSGEFTDVAGIVGNDYIAKWNGSNWESLGEHVIDGDEVDLQASSLLVDSTSGTDILYVAGGFYWEDHEDLQVAKWDGTAWSAIEGDSPLDGYVNSLAQAPTGALVAVGQFGWRNEDSYSSIASWDGKSWRPLGSDDAYLTSVVVTSDSRLIVGGRFSDLGDSATADWLAISQPVARLRNVGTSATVTPNIGPENGGSRVTLMGTHFSQATQVKFGTNVATDLTVVSADSISVTTPAHAPGVVDVSIISPSGTQVFPSAFTYFEPVSSVVDTEEELLLLPEQSITAKNQFVAGDSLTISVPGLVPGERVQFILASTPELLASTTADVDGVATATFVFPRDVHGFHTLAVFAPISARGMRQAIFIHPFGTVIGLGTLPKTGSEIQLWLPFVIAILGFLLITISGNRRRKIA